MGETVNPLFRFVYDLYRLIHSDPRFAFGPLAVLFFITIIVGTVHDGGLFFLVLPWWVFITVWVYFVCAFFRLRAESIFGCIAKVYSPFVVFIYWLAIYPTHNPWKDHTETFLVIVVYMIAPWVMFWDLVRPCNMGNPTYAPRNVNFPVFHSFTINTVFYIVYVVVYMFALPDLSDPIYTGIGIKYDEGEDVMVLIIGWILVMAINIIIAIGTWISRKRNNEYQMAENEDIMMHSFI